MGSSPGSNDDVAPAQQGPPIDQLMPAQPPPRPMNALPSGGGVANGLTPQMLQAWAQEQARRDAAVASMYQPHGGDAAGGPPGAPTGGADPTQTSLTAATDPRAQLVKVLASALQRGDRNDGGYTTSGSGARSSASYGPGSLA